MTKDFPSVRFVHAGGVKLAAYEVDGDAERKRPPILLVHGWPEIAYSWRNQIYALAEAGFRVIAIDLKGFGQSDAPEAISVYDAKNMTADFKAVLNSYEIERAIFCGHDWGGSLVWSMGQLHRERVAGVIGVCTPAKQRAPAPPLQIIENRFTSKHYFIQFQEIGVAENLFAQNPRRFFRLMFCKPAPKERWAELVPRVFDLPGRFIHAPEPADNDLIVSNDIIDEYVKAYQRSGFRGGVNIYRNIDRNWAYMEGKDQTISAPSLWIGAELDLFLPPESAEGMEKIAPDLEKHIIKDCGHWVTWEQPEALNAVMIDWLKRRFPPPAS